MLEPNTPAPPAVQLPSAILPIPEENCRLQFPDIFGIAGPVEVDVGCGKGRFLIARAQAAPDTLFLGIDKRLQRIQKVDRKIRREGLRNVRLLMAEAASVVEELLPALSVRAFYIFFPDPWPKRRHHRRRLFSPPFLTALHRAMSEDGRVYVATDDGDYFAWIHALLKQDRRFVECAAYEPGDADRTEFETTFLKLGSTIHRCGFAKVTTVDPT